MSLNVELSCKKNEIRKDPFTDIKWKLNLESDCFSSCNGGYCPSYCGTNGFCCSGDEKGFIIDVDAFDQSNQGLVKSNQSCQCGTSF